MNLLGSVFLALLAATLLLLSTDLGHARPYALWGGVVQFEMPVGARSESLGANQKIFYAGRSAEEPSILAYFKRFRLSAQEQRASTDRLAEMQRSNFQKDGISVSNFAVDRRRQRVSMDLAFRITKSDPYVGNDYVPIALSGSEARVRARFVAYRSGSQIFQVIVLSEARKWDSLLGRSFRNMAGSMRVKR